MYLNPYDYDDIESNNSFEHNDYQLNSLIIFNEWDNIINIFPLKNILNQNIFNSNDFSYYEKLDRANSNDKTEKISKEKTRTKKHRLKKNKKSSKKNISDCKYYEDNIIRKIKFIIISLLSSYINSIINKVYKDNIGKGIFKKELLRMNYNGIMDSKLDTEFIKKKLKDIFSNIISTKYIYHSPDHNKIIIEQILSENNIEKRKIFENLFSLTFLECIMHIRGTKYYKELEGLESLDDICKKFEDDNDYVELFKYYVFHFEEIIMNKKQRNALKRDK